MATNNVSRCVKRNEPTLLQFTSPIASYQGEGENFPFTFEAADERCYIIVKNDGSKNVYCGFFNPKTYTVEGRQLVKGKTTVVIPIESGKITKHDSIIVFNLTPATATDILSEANVSVAAFQSGIITH